MAGIAIVSLLNTSGLLAIAIAWAAFCIPISMTMVRRSFTLRCMSHDSSTPLPIAKRMSTVIERPSCAKLSIIASRFWMKNTVARKISAGNATFDSTLWILCAAVCHLLRTAIPTSMGKNMSTIFCMKSLPTGRCTLMWLPALAVTHSMISGTVNRVIMLLQAVSDTDNATSPRASIENTLEELPPGQHAMSTNPMRKMGSKCSAHPMSHARAGKTIICPRSPASTGFGRSLKSLKSSSFKFNPSSNISRVRMGNTIQIVFIVSYYKSCRIYYKVKELFVCIVYYELCIVHYALCIMNCAL